jgi:hypothetical protein
MNYHKLKIYLMLFSISLKKKKIKMYIVNILHVIGNMYTTYTSIYVYIS